MGGGRKSAGKKERKEEIDRTNSPISGTKG